MLDPPKSPNYILVFTKKGGILCHGVPRSATARGAGEAGANGLYVRTGAHRPCGGNEPLLSAVPPRGHTTTAVVTGLASRQLNSETLSPETFRARSEQACSDRAPDDLSKCPPERRTA